MKTKLTPLAHLILRDLADGEKRTLTSAPDVYRRAQRALIAADLVVVNDRGELVLTPEGATRAEENN